MPRTLRLLLQMVLTDTYTFELGPGRDKKIFLGARHFSRVNTAEDNNVICSYGYENEISVKLQLIFMQNKLLNSNQDWK